MVAPWVVTEDIISVGGIFATPAIIFCGRKTFGLSRALHNSYHIRITLMSALNPQYGKWKAPEPVSYPGAPLFL